LHDRRAGLHDRRTGVHGRITGLHDRRTGVRDGMAMLLVRDRRDEEHGRRLKFIKFTLST
jgi:hypothetical protein